MLPKLIWNSWAQAILLPPSGGIIGMSRSQFGQGQKPLDVFFWVNEISGEITYPPQKADAPAVSPGSPQEKAPSWPRSMQGAPCSPQGPPAQRPAPAPPSKASLKDLGSGNPRPSAPTWGQARAGGARSPPPFSAIPVTISSPGVTLPILGPLGPAPQPPISTSPLSPSAPWDFTCKVKNVLTGNNWFSF
ncbi:putative uncharacterized protein LINC00694 isoform X1 [Theropithecus gelada]|uniref:putative uncharacterized protein LINC00694 isoform X1 n=2 Tax=Theropithecus gelada TaxID=9565 RepID=UPI000DC17D31|nr:putative uncharacterized protein LINC00694 isoform X1 [Theropithecus gelada]